jgi:hypothetical protein
MHESQRYRDSAAQCLLAAQDTRAASINNRKIRVSMAVSWLSLARQVEAMDKKNDPAVEAAPGRSLDRHA